MSDVAGMSPSPRRVAKPSWLDLRFVLGLVLVLAAVLIGALVFARANHRHPMVVATRDLAAGTVLNADDLTLAQVQLPDRGAHVYLATVSAAVGKQLQRPVSAGELVPSSAVRKSAPQTTVTVPFAAASAPELRPGQRIEIWVSTPHCTSVVVLPSVVVQDVRTDPVGSFTSGTGGQDVVISVDPSLADRVIAALAIDQAQVRAGVLTGSAPASLSAPLRPTDPRSGLPADLARCADAPGSR
jgi:hypothetical protein